MKSLWVDVLINGLIFTAFGVSLILHFQKAKAMTMLRRLRRTMFMFSRSSQGGMKAGCSWFALLEREG